MRRTRICIGSPRFARAVPRPEGRGAANLSRVRGSGVGLDEVERRPVVVSAARIVVQQRLDGPGGVGADLARPGPSERCGGEAELSSKFIGPPPRRADGAPPRAGPHLGGRVDTHPAVLGRYRRLAAPWRPVDLARRHGTITVGAKDRACGTYRSGAPRSADDRSPLPRTRPRSDLFRRAAVRPAALRS
jgi:hypothetical protein